MPPPVHFAIIIVAYVTPKNKGDYKMSLNLYSLIIQAANENNVNMTLAEIGKVNDRINNLISRGVNAQWIENNLEILL